MTVEQPKTVLALLEEDPTVRAYQYRHRRTGRTLYALFPGGQYDDMAVAPEVRDPTLLYDAGHYTEAGASWLSRLVTEGEPS